MRTGPLGRRNANSSRLIASWPAAPSRPAAEPSSDAVRFSPRGPTPSATRMAIPAAGLRLQCQLPINLREFLAAHFGSGVRIDEDGVFTLESGMGDETISQVARAIRLFSTQRAHETWSECAVPIARLREALAAGIPGKGRVVLCLRCALFESHHDAIESHRDGGCVAVDLSVDNFPAQSAGETEITDLVMNMVEGFRLARAALSLPHFDLDCYVARESIAFTWRPLTP